MSKWNELIQRHISRSFGERTEYLRTQLPLRACDRGNELSYRDARFISQHIAEHRTQLRDKKILYLKRTRPARDLPLEFKLKMRGFEPAYWI